MEPSPNMPEHVLVFFPTYLTGADGHDAWDLHDAQDWDEGRQCIGGGPDSRAGARDDDPAALAAWVGERLGFPVTLHAETYKIGYPLAVVDGYRRGEPEAWHTEPLYRVRRMAVPGPADGPCAVGGTRPGIQPNARLSPVGRARS